MAVATRTGSRHGELGLTDERMLEMYYYMLLTRRLDERLWLLQRSGKIPFVISAQGQEGAQVGAAFALEKGVDWVVPYYRDLGTVLVMGMTPREVFLHAFAREGDPSSGGRQMAHHWSHRRWNIVSGSSPVATQVPHAVGIALGARMQGKNIVVLTALGEGSSNQGDFHEALNFAGVHKLPVIVHVQNNEYAISVPLRKQLACQNVADRAAGYGMPGVVVDGTDVLEVYRVFREAVARARRGEGPTLIESKNVRLTAHSSDDDDKTYRPREELEAARRRDPLATTRQYLYEAGLLDEAREKELEDRVRREIDEAAAWAEAQPHPSVESMFRHVYKEA
ncbi:2-oxoisovalerate dehydrogenase subunit alpha [Caldinitratiruptor microaerophilus]|uniref:2-oxoisovalerate dehydrogenase subunit alpha n=2 Tax=Caldinitratiruptor microaerophilus TaxID=671077 RepID=A0AA35CM45_9FIRM|nr:2-oxoisovalerate dehydrogenase subunit alpha [Caldinitratiruptor microaerophilus]